MGASHGLTAPVLDKLVEDGQSEALRFGAASMQGWRRSQEDAHIALPKLGHSASRALFAVFDGHGGHEVAALCARRLPELLRADARLAAPHATVEQVAAALVAAHFWIDDFIASADGQAELHAILDAAAHEQRRGAHALAASDGAPAHACAVAPSSAALGELAPAAPVGDGAPSAALDGALHALLAGAHAARLAHERSAAASTCGGNLGGAVAADSAAVAARAADAAEAEAAVAAVAAAEAVSTTAPTLSARARGAADGEGVVWGGAVQPANGGDVDVAAATTAAEATTTTAADDDDDDDDDDDADYKEGDDDDDDGNGDDGSGGGVPEHAVRAINFMRAHAGERAEWPGYSSGCTAVCALVRDGCVLVSNVGDSRALLCRNGMPLALSNDHKPDSPTERARIVKAGGFVRAGRCCANLNLSRAVGDLNYKSVRGVRREAQPISPEPDVRVATLREGDEFLLLGCDGIFEVLSNQQIVDFVRRRMPPLAPCADAAGAAAPSTGPGDGAAGGGGGGAASASTAGARQLSSICAELFDLCIAKPRGFRPPRAPRGNGDAARAAAPGAAAGAAHGTRGAPGKCAADAADGAGGADESGEESSESSEQSESDDGYGYDNMTAVLVDVRQYALWWREQQGGRAEGGGGGRHKRAAPDARAPPHQPLDAGLHEPWMVKLPRLE
ncbi:hypothetical protein KFE25_002310 [Diacronema lutheri]|uniref:PPM-type phosphatase domain-containing protein n=1 Tax=Diacronema lutheri TaxID=2081491 RepID=A0A8J5X0H4_DIALT|nr:hypothetical protein KFE25_002310 [Diacronema lutheri]